MRYEDMIENKELATGLMLACVPQQVRDVFISIVLMAEALDTDVTHRPDPGRVRDLILRFYMDGVAIDDPGSWSLKGRAEMLRSLLEYSLATVAKKCENIRAQ